MFARWLPILSTATLDTTIKQCWKAPRETLLGLVGAGASLKARPQSRWGKKNTTKVCFFHEFEDIHGVERRHVSRMICIANDWVFSCQASKVQNHKVCSQSLFPHTGPLPSSYSLPSLHHHHRRDNFAPSSELKSLQKSSVLVKLQGLGWYLWRNWWSCQEWLRRGWFGHT